MSNLLTTRKIELICGIRDASEFLGQGMSLKAAKRIADELYTLYTGKRERQHTVVLLDAFGTSAPGCWAVTCNKDGIPVVQPISLWIFLYAEKFLGVARAECSIILLN